MGPAARSIDGVTAAAPVVRGPVDVGRAIRSGQLLAFDPATAPGLVNFPDEASAATVPGLLAGLADQRPQTNSVPIPADARRLALALDSAIVADLTAFPEDVPAEEAPLDWRGIDVTFLLEDADGRLHKVVGTAPGLNQGEGQRIEADLTRLIDDELVEFPGPARLQGVELSFRMPSTPIQMVGIGNVDIKRHRGEPVAERRRRLERHRLGAERTGLPLDVGAIRRAARLQRRRRAHRAGSRSRSSRGPPSRSSAEAARCSARRPRRQNPEHVPAVVGREFLEASGAKVGDEVAASVSGQRLTLADPRRHRPVPVARPDAALRDRRRDDAGARPPGGDRPGPDDEGVVALGRSGGGAAGRGGAAPRADRRHGGASGGPR